MYVVAVTAGLRRGELQDLKWEDVDLSGVTGTLQIRRTLSEPKGGCIFEAPKSGKGRSIRLTQRAAGALREHRKRRLEESMERGALWQDHGLVFPSGSRPRYSAPDRRRYAFMTSGIHAPRYCWGRA